MNREVDEVRKRIARRKQNQVKKGESIQQPRSLVQDAINSVEYSIFDEEEKEVISIGKGFFLLKVMFSIILVAGVAILFRNNTTTAQKMQAIVSAKMEREFQFATVSNWYEERFGTPLTFLNNGQKNNDKQSDYAMPASGKVLENFKTNGQGILIETEVNAEVEAIEAGVVIFVGEKDGIGTAVVIQHTDGSESWYGKLKDVSVKSYQHVDKKEVIGKASDEELEQAGTYYLAIKQDDGFIDPNKVISFE